MLSSRQKSIIFLYVTCFKLYTDTLIVLIPPIFVEKLFFEHFVLEPCTCNAFAPFCSHALGLLDCIKHAQVLNAQIFRATTKHYLFLIIYCFCRKVLERSEF